MLYFYPKDNTAGCTKQACGFGELYPQFQEKDAVVLGVTDCYTPEKFTFDVLKEEYGIFAVRGPRGIPSSLSEALKAK